MLSAMARHDGLEVLSLRSVVAQPSGRGSWHQLLQTCECEPCRSPVVHTANVCLQFCATGLSTGALQSRARSC